MKIVCELRDVPLAVLTVKNLRILLSQGVGIDVLTLVALGILDADPFAGDDFYPGDCWPNGTTAWPVVAIAFAVV